MCVRILIIITKHHLKHVMEDISRIRKFRLYCYKNAWPEQVEKAACWTSERKWLLKKSSGILCEGNRLEAYRFIQKHGKKFGLRWLLRKFHICPNAYYNYLKNRKADYFRKKKAIKASIQEIYHSHDGVDGYRTIIISDCMSWNSKNFSYFLYCIHILCLLNCII